MNQKSSLREGLQFVSQVLTANNLGLKSQFFTADEMGSYPQGAATL
jgi:hypothetical protein